jgi:hypothetical protein
LQYLVPSWASVSWVLRAPVKMCDLASHCLDETSCAAGAWSTWHKASFLVHVSRTSAYSLDIESASVPTSLDARHQQRMSDSQVCLDCGTHRCLDQWHHPYASLCACCVSSSKYQSSLDRACLARQGHQSMKYLLCTRYTCSQARCNRQGRCRRDPHSCVHKYKDRSSYCVSSS